MDAFRHKNIVQAVKYDGGIIMLRVCFSASHTFLSCPQIITEMFKTVV